MKSSVAHYWHLLRQYLAPQWRAVLLMTTLLLTSVGLQLATPQVIRGFIDTLQHGATIQVLRQTALLFLTITFAQQAMRVLTNYWSQRVAWTATNALRVDLAAHVLRLDLSFHQVHTAGELIERVDGDVRELAEFFSSFTVQLASSALLLAGVLVAVWFVDWRLGVAFTLFALLALLVLSWVRHAGTPHWQADREEHARLYGYLGEVLTATEDLRTSGAVPYVMQRFFRHLQGWLPVRLWAGFWGQSVMTTVILLFAIGDTLTYSLTGRLFWNETISLGTVYLVVAYMAMLAAPIEEIRLQMQNLQQADASINRVRELRATISTLSNGNATLPDGPLPITFHNVSFAYTNHLTPNHPVPNHQIPQHPTPTLHNISFHLPAGRTLGLLGHTGSGKTTLTRLLFRFYDPQRGTIRLGNIDSKRSDLVAWRSQVGLVTQEVQLFEATLRENLTFFDSAISDAQLLTAIDALQLNRWLARLPQGLDTTISSETLSAGEAQLVALARLFLKDPGLVILDEASSRLDPATEQLLDQALTTLLAGRTAIIIAHRLTTIASVDDILILENGIAREYGERSVLAANPDSYYSQLQRTGLQAVMTA